MLRRVEDSTIYSFPHAFIGKKGEPILIAALDDKRYERLTAMYLAYEPKGSFHGLPPMKDEACVKWVRHMIQNGINLVASNSSYSVPSMIARKSPKCHW